MATCGACGQEITTCEECGGKKCRAGCPDRREDGCRCEEGAGSEQAS